MPELAPKRDDIILYKHRYSGFYETDLDSVLKRRSINSLIFTGCTTSVCVESTLRDAMFRDYTCLLLADCTAEPGLARLVPGGGALVAWNAARYDGQAHRRSALLVTRLR